jgi:hypothetical protein
MLSSWVCRCVERWFNVRSFETSKSYLTATFRPNTPYDNRCENIKFDMIVMAKQPSVNPQKRVKCGRLLRYLFRIAGFLDFVHRPELLKPRNHNVSEAGSVSIFRRGKENTCSVGSITTVVINVGYAGTRKHLTLIKIEHRNLLSLEPALIPSLTKIRLRIEVLACQKQAQSSN